MIKVIVTSGKNKGDISKDLTEFYIEPAENYKDNVAQFDFLLTSGGKININVRYISNLNMFAFYSVSLNDKLIASLHNYYLSPNGILPLSLTVITPENLYLTFLFEIEH